MKLQETIELTTPVLEKKVVIRGFVTGYQLQEISALVLKSGNMNGGVAQVTSDDPFAAINRAFEMLVVSVDGATDNILDAILSLPVQDYTFVKEEVDKIQRPLPAKSA